MTLPVFMAAYIYIYILVSLTRVCVVYVVNLKEVVSFWGARSINSVMHNTKKETCLSL